MVADCRIRRSIDSIDPPPTRGVHALCAVLTDASLWVTTSVNSCALLSAKGNPSSCAPQGSISSQFIRACQAHHIDVLGLEKVGRFIALDVADLLKFRKGDLPD